MADLIVSRTSLLVPRDSDCQPTQTDNTMHQDHDYK